MDWHEADETFERIRRTDRGAMPAGKENARKAATKKTRASERATKRVGKQGGIRKRRNKKRE